MTSANVDLVRSLFAAWGRGDYGSAEWAHPEIEYVIVDGPSPGTWTGVPGMVAAWRNQLDAWDGHHAEAEDYLELDDERVLALVHSEGRGKTSGLEIGLWSKGALLFHIRDGKVTRLVISFDRERMLADLGLTEEGELR